MNVTTDNASGQPLALSAVRFVVTSRDPEWMPDARPGPVTQEMDMHHS